LRRSKPWYKCLVQWSCLPMQ